MVSYCIRTAVSLACALIRAHDVTVTPARRSPLCLFALLCTSTTALVAGACETLPALDSVTTIATHLAPAALTTPTTDERTNTIRDAEYLNFIIRASQNDYSRPDQFPSGLALSPASVRRELARFRASPAAALWIGHSTFLIHVDGLTILTDPIFFDTASPFASSGPRRYAPAALGIDDLPAIDVILISHDHYDHLDVRSLEGLAVRFPRAAVLLPRGNERLATDAGFKTVTGLVPIQSITVSGHRIAAMPAYHETSRTPHRIDGTQALGWAIRSPRGPSLYFTGDTAYGPFFKHIRRSFGAFDVAFVPIGAYAPEAENQHAHVTPEQAAQIAGDLGASVAIAMHWGTFPLSDEPVMEPPRRFKAAAGNNVVLRIGQAVVLGRGLGDKPGL